MIITHLSYDIRSLRACSLTCYSWYIAAVHPLYYTLITPTYYWCRNKFLWPEPLRYMHKLGLLPLVKEFQVQIRSPIGTDGFSPELFNCRILRQFSALTNVQGLGIDCLDVHKFMPRIRRYFGQFLPTVRSLTLREPRGSRRQILYFIGLFQHLDDLKLYSVHSFQERPTGDLTLIPPFTPPLRGRLTMTRFGSMGFLKDMIDLFGGIRFRCMDLFEVDGMRLLLGACAETLEVLRLYPTDRRGKEISLDGMQVLADNSSASFSLGDIDLSQNRSLRALEVTASSVIGGEPEFLTRVLSTITSPAFSEVVVFYRDYTFPGVRGSPLFLDLSAFRMMSDADIVEQASKHHRRFELFREMHKVRGFQLVLCADVWDRVVEYTVQVLKQAVAVEKANGGFGGLFSEPLVVSTPRRSPPGITTTWSVDSCIPWTPL